MATKEDIVARLRDRFPDLVEALDEVAGTHRVLGVVVSTEFDGLDHERRQDLLWEVLDEAFTAEQLTNVGPLATLTPIEAEIKTTEAG